MRSNCATMQKRKCKQYRPAKVMKEMWKEFSEKEGIQLICSVDKRTSDQLRQGYKAKKQAQVQVRACTWNEQWLETGCQRNKWNVCQNLTWDYKQGIAGQNEDKGTAWKIGHCTRGRNDRKWRSCSTCDMSKVIMTAACMSAGHNII